MENWSWIEVVWTLVAVIGAAFSAKNINDGLEDLKIVSIRDPDNIDSRIMRVVSWGNLRRDSLRFLIQFMYVIMGVMAGLIPSNPNPSPIGPIGMVIGIGLVSSSIILTLSAIQDQSDRRKSQELGKQKQLEEGNVSIGIE